jgi:hypothetical protein
MEEKQLNDGIGDTFVSDVVVPNIDRCVLDLNLICYSGQRRDRDRANFAFPVEEDVHEFRFLEPDHCSQFGLQPYNAFTAAGALLLLTLEIWCSLCIRHAKILPDRPFQYFS